MDNHATQLQEGFLPPLPPSSSPASTHLLSPTRSSRRKERRDPSVTPRRFGRFFTPRNSQSIPGRRILANVASEDLNRQPLSPTSLLGEGLSSDPIIPSSPSKTPRGHGRKRSAGQSSVSPIVERRGLILGDMQPPRLNLPQREDVAMSNADHLEECRKATLVCPQLVPPQTSLADRTRTASSKPPAARIYHTQKTPASSKKPSAVRPPNANGSHLPKDTIPSLFGSSSTAVSVPIF